MMSLKIKKRNGEDAAFNPQKIYNRIKKAAKGLNVNSDEIFIKVITSVPVEGEITTKELDKLVKVLKDNPTIEIELSSHTDCRATIKYNQQLSSKRAESAVEYMASQGVEKNRMIAAGYGESRLVNKCACEGKQIVPCTEEQHQENRRTEFKILKF